MATVASVLSTRVRTEARATAGTMVAAPPITARRLIFSHDIAFLLVVCECTEPGGGPSVFGRSRDGHQRRLVVLVASPDPSYPAAGRGACRIRRCVTRVK